MKNLRIRKTKNDVFESKEDMKREVIKLRKDLEIKEKLISGMKTKLTRSTVG